MNNYSLYLKFNILIVGSIFFCGLLVECLFLFTMSSILEDNLDQKGQSTAESISSIISNNILLDDKFAISEQLIQSLEQDAEIRYIIVTSPSKEIISSTFSQGFPVGLPLIREPKNDGENIDKMIFGSDEGRLREILYPIDDGIIGSIRIGLTEKYMTEVLKERCLQMSLIILFICILASILATYYARHFLHPIRELSKAADEIGKGNYKIQKIPVTTKDEIGQFTNAFNDMTTKLRAKEQENGYLLAALKRKEKKHLWLISQLFAVREDERRRISRELHDETNQSMVSILTYLRVLYDRLDNDEQRELLAQTRELTVHTLEGLRGIAVDLHPPILEDLGLVAAIQKYVDTIRRSYPDLDIELRHTGEFSDIPTMISLVCYRILQESLTNIVRHAKATKAMITISRIASNIIILINDNGVGFNKSVVKKVVSNRHLGLVSMRERIELLNGYFKIYSKENHGTRIIIVLPIKNNKEAYYNGKTNFKNSFGR